MGLLHRLLSDDSSVLTLSEQGVDRDSFTESERAVFDFIIEHAASHGVLPRIATVEAECEITFPSFPAEPMSYWITSVEQRRRVAMIVRGAKTMQDSALEGNLDGAIMSVQTLYLGLQMRGATRTAVSQFRDIAQGVLEQHDRTQFSSRMNGVRFGIPYLDEISDGAQPGDTVALVGRPAAGKSYFLAQMSLCAFDDGEVPLVATYEMPTIQWARRLIALRTHVSATRIRLGRLSHWGRDRVVVDVGSLREMDETKRFYIMHGTLKSTVEDLVLAVQEYRPTVLYVDGAYLLRTNSKSLSRWERVSEAAEYLKMIALEFHIPVIATYQFNRRGPGDLGNIAFSDSVGQLASIVLGIDEEDENMEIPTLRAVRYKLLDLLKGREGEKGLIRILYDMDRMLIQQDAVLRGYQLTQE